jgi:hypothetical protein
MASNTKKTREHMFSIQLKSKDDLKSVALSNDEEGNILIEGFLGKLENINFTEGVMLEINGANGSLRMDFSEEELRGLLPKEASISKKESRKSGGEK